MSVKICETKNVYQIKYFNSDLYRHSSKTFNRSKPDPELTVLDFWLNLTTDLYITACPDLIYKFAVDNNHQVLRAKCWQFFPEAEMYCNKKNNLPRP
jgi:hypothetical protein